MKNILIVQNGDHVPRVTHHDDELLMQMELGSFIASNGYTQQSPFIVINYDKIPDLGVDKMFKFPGGFFACLSPNNEQPWVTVIHIWDRDLTVHELKITPYASKKECFGHIDDCLAKESQKKYARKHGHICFTNSDGLRAELFIVDTRTSEYTQF